MVKHFKTILIAGISAIIGLVSCTTETDFNGRLTNLEERVSKLEKLCAEMNTNISSLQGIVSALQNQDYITAVNELTSDGKVIGYTINFAKGQPITIYHGKDGADGKDGSTPVIGVKQDTDGIWYWTLNGEWLLDDNGQKIKAVGTDGKDGQNGKDGQDGAPGKDGITPLLKIEDGYWYISYDNGTNWTKLDKAVGEDGKDGKDGKDGDIGLTGDSLFTGIDTSDSDFVVFTLSDGTEIKIPTWYAFEQLRTLVNQINSNIEGLQAIVTALQNNDYITSILPIVENGKEIGYIFNFTKSGSVTIYHGADGKDGQDGADGHTPVIGVKQDTDGVWYWTIEGEWLLDTNNQKVRAVGLDGQPGQDGITPQLKIEDGYWYLSYDNGASWTKLDKAVGEDGKDGSNGLTGDSMFTGIDTSDTEYVVFTLIDGTEIKIPTWYAFEQLRTLVNQINSNIEGLQAIVTALQNNDYITSILPIVENGKEIGYIFNFTKSGSVTIYHGADGKDGQDGADGHTPVIGVKQDTDGVWYWTIDGEWLLDGNGQKVKAVGTDGKDGVNGQDGTNGQNGQDGQDGKDGITPQLKIEEGYWYVSTDNGQTWTQLGKATGENGKDGVDGKDGKDGVDGVDGDSMFQSVTVTETEVTFVTSDGQTFVVKRAAALSIEFDSADLVVMGTNSTRNIHYTITSGVDNITIEALSSADIKVKVVKTDAKTGTLQVKTGATIDEYSKVVVLVSNGSQAIMRTLNFEAEAIEVEEDTTKEVSNGGGEVELEFFSNVSCHVIIPDDAQNWISVAPETKALTKQVIGLIIQPNTGSARSATVTVQSEDGSISLPFIINQEERYIAVLSITLNNNSAVLKTGQSLSLTATVNPTNATDKTVTWSTTDATVASVSEGVVTAKAIGSATITAKAGNKTASCTITVISSATGISLNKTSVKIAPGSTVILNASVTPSTCTDPVVWTTTDPSIATVNNGIVYGIAIGTTTIKASVGDYSASCTVTVTTNTIGDWEEGDHSSGSI